MLFKFVKNLKRLRIVRAWSSFVNFVVLICDLAQGSEKHPPLSCDS